ncbi:DUF255 domain-containing protein [Solitalea sp. MAHUQ-68]|uniref:DUF255 domain-containing protein n=1 Tax=Solitalea agri TaxID=2953739 RepID=A0A9X2F4T4_9SPHI|nr:thioredoxin fold domain-containing protein [Solitalea agri]MCO4294199.1 DUF255 domain-containing protein [Solitalea agri]
MKRLLIFLLITLPFLGFSQQTNFIPGTWEAIVAKAKAENKPIFVDCYFEGCMPCKQMDLTVYTNKSVAEFLNEKFISYKIDVFKEADGKMFCKKYGLRGFPSFLFIAPNGKLIDQSSGFIGANRFANYLNEVNTSFKAEKFLAYSIRMDESYPMFYSETIEKRTRKTTPEEINAFFDAQKNLFTEQVFNVLTYFGTPQNYIDWHLTNAVKLSKLFGRMPVRNQLLSIVSKKAKVFAAEKNTDGYEKLLLQIKPLFIDGEWLRFEKIFNEEYFKDSKDVVWYMNTVEQSSSYDWADKTKVIADVLPLIKENSGQLNQLKAWFNGKLSTNVPQCDFYNAAVIELYLQNYDAATVLVNKMKEGEKSYLLKTDDMLALQQAIDQKTPETFKPTKAYNVKPLLMD